MLSHTSMIARRVGSSCCDSSSHERHPGASRMRPMTERRNSRSAAASPGFAWNWLIRVMAKQRRLEEEEPSECKGLLLSDQNDGRAATRDLRGVRERLFPARRGRARLERVERGKMHLGDTVKRGLALGRALNLGRDELCLAGEFLHGHRDVLILVESLERLHILRGWVHHHQLDRGHELLPSCFRIETVSGASGKRWFGSPGSPRLDGLVCSIDELTDWRRDAYDAYHFRGEGYGGHLPESHTKASRALYKISPLRERTVTNAETTGVSSRFVANRVRNLPSMVMMPT